MLRTWPLWALVTLLPPASALAQARPARNEAVHRLTEAAGAPVSVTISPETGGVTFLSVPAGEGIPVGISPTAAADERALAFLAGHGEGFFLRGKSQVAVRRVSARDEVGLEHVRVQQMHRGVPVTGAELVVHLRGDRVTAVNGQTLDGLDALAVEPAVQPAEAQETVRRALGGKDQSIAVTVGEPRLEVFNRGLLEKRRYPTRLAWFVEATGPRMREFVWVDAERGNVLLRFSQLPHAKNRAIHSSASTASLPGTLIRSEGGGATGDLDVNAAYDFLGHSYDYFFVNHGRDGFDAFGGVIRATVDYCPSGPPNCPYVNAFWDGQIQQLVFGDQMSRADDVVAHEFTHAVTEYTGNLFYYMQSGALNEAFSDIFGETVDLGNGAGNDAPAQRWVIGEDVYVGAARNMMNPVAMGDPGKMSDSGQFVCAQPGGDGGGVHSNSGILNHAYALMVDGGSYNGRTITGIGLVKAGKVAYRALDSYLVSASGFFDTYQAFRQACYDLVGGAAAITINDCAQVQLALDAVELSDPWPCAGPPARIPPLCPLGQAANNVFFDDFTTGAPTWGTESATVIAPGQWFLGDFYGTSDPLHIWTIDHDVVSHARLVTTPMVLPANARLQFNHAYGFENDAGGFYDGGRIEYRNEAGPGPWLDGSPLFTVGTTYDGTISGSFGNPIGGLPAFAGHSFGYTASQYNLSSLAGQNTRFALRVASDSSFGDFGWFIDDVRIYTCGTPSDLIFANGFDAGNLTAWSAQNTGGGDLVANAPSALVGTPFGMQATVNDTTGLFVTDNTPNDEARYRARFYLDPNTFDPGEAGLRFRARVFLGFEDQGLSGLRRLFAVVLRRQAGQYALMGRAQLDSGGQSDTGFFNITNAPHAVEIEWVKSNGTNNGAFEMWIDGVSVRRLTGLDNDLAGVDLARLGALSLKPGANGVMFLDHFDSRRVNYIGQ